MHHKSSLSKVEPYSNFKTIIFYRYELSRIGFRAFGDTVDNYYFLFSCPQAFPMPDSLIIMTCLIYKSATLRWRFC